jgi:hypothetical protein
VNKYNRAQKRLEDMFREMTLGMTEDEMYAAIPAFVDRVRHDSDETLRNASPGAIALTLTLMLETWWPDSPWPHRAEGQPV